MHVTEPFRSQRPDLVLRAVEREGVAIYTPILDGSASPVLTADDAVRSGHVIFGGRVVVIPEPAEVRSGGVRDRTADPIDETMPLPPHTDGFAYGDYYPDYFLLGCARSSEVGGESLVVDGHAVVAKLAAQRGGADLIARMSTVPIDQTEPGMRPALSPLIGRTKAGRLMLRRFPFQKPAPDSEQPERDAQMIERWQEAVADAATLAPRFKVSSGEVVVFDNYRMMHGREPYTDTDRLMWRVWVWTDSAHGVPEGRLHSDTRYASTTPEPDTATTSSAVSPSGSPSSD